MKVQRILPLCSSLRTTNRNQKRDFTKCFYDVCLPYEKKNSSVIPFQSYFLNKKISFRGKPERLYYSAPENAFDAIKIWERLKTHSYSDMHDDYIYPEYKKIREENYSFLDELHTERDKRDFINNFERFTSFPNLEATSQKIIDEFKRAVIIAEYINNVNSCSDHYHVVCAGYNDSCSVGRNFAFPGSDLDGAYVVIKGDPFNEYNDAWIVDNYKKELWFNTDARILSYNHRDAFPQVYTLRQVEKIIDEINRNLKRGYISQDIYDKQYEVKRYYNTDYVEANPFYVNFAKQFESDSVSKEQLKNFAFFADSFINGATVYHDKNMYNDLYCKCCFNTFFDNINMSQIIRAKENEPKEKLLSRIPLQYKFNEYDTDKQYEIVKDIIRGMSGDNREEEYFKRCHNSYANLTGDFRG